ncbi:LysM peptidoglycan-binding domain-containing protein, partial [Mycobacterium gordonae]|nr:LysM peptidoglycan-binding domain-containing protein [Mycobacterium gordonae]
GFHDVEAAQIGEFTVIGKRRLTDYQFSSFFPRDYNSTFCAYNPPPDPWESVNQIRRWQTSGNPVRLTISGTPINSAVTIRSFNIEPERGGSPGDIYYDIALKEYAFVKYRDVNSEDSRIKVAGPARPNTAAKPSRYTVVSGDSLFKIAQRLLNDGDRWRDIYNANKALIGANPNLIYPGQTLVIP